MNMPQQQNRAQPRAGGKQQDQPEDYYGRLRNMLVRVFLSNGQQLVGVLNMVARFQVGLLINGEQVYVNKGFIIMIKPEQLPAGQGNAKRGDGQNGGRGF